MQKPHLSVNQLAQPLVEQLLQQAKVLHLGISLLDSGCTIVDAGIEAKGSVEAGRLIAEICMGGLGKVHVADSTRFGQWPGTISVSSDNPVLACLASQYAGWALSHEKFFALGSGPARALAQREDLFKELDYQDDAASTCIVLETSKVPPAEIIEKILRDTKVNAQNLTLILTPTTSIAGATQIVGRVLEVALHTAHTLHFPLNDIVSGTGVAVLPPVASDFMIAMGRTNDAILFGGTVNLHVRGSNDSSAKLAEALPSLASKDYGKPFAQVFKSYNMDFYQIDPMLFSSAQVTINNLDSGEVFEGGRLNAELLALSFADQVAVNS